MLLQKQDLTDMLMYIAGQCDNCQSDQNLSCIPLIILLISEYHEKKSCHKEKQSQKP